MLSGQYAQQLIYVVFSCLITNICSLEFCDSFAVVFTFGGLHLYSNLSGEQLIQDDADRSVQGAVILETGLEDADRAVVFEDADLIDRVGYGGQDLIGEIEG